MFMEKHSGLPNEGKAVLLPEAFGEIQTLEWLPSPSPVLCRLLELLSRESNRAEDLERAITQDPVMCAQVLKAGNSAFYGYRGMVKSVSRAMVIIGTEEIRNICLSICLMQQFSRILVSKSFDANCFWRHSLLTGLTAQKLAEDTGLIEKEDAYILGLLHDLGRMVMAVQMPVYFERLVQTAGRRETSLYESEKIERLPHTDVGLWVSMKWALPELIRSVLRWHHDPLEAGDFSREAALVHIAASLAQLFCDAGYKNSSALPSDDAMNLIGFGKDDYSAHAAGVRELSARVDALCDTLR
jgi:HD-like signal output (HDOD) protein